MNVGIRELAIILSIAALLLGTKQLQTAAKGAGRALRELKKTKQEVEDSLLK
jgi:TatA/E family protein of Tat protein translocase